MQYNGKYILILIGIIILLMGIIIGISEAGNMLTHFWYTNLFAGFWTSLILFHYAITIFASNCSSVRRYKKYLIFSGLLASVSLAALISLDALFLVKPETCLLTTTCTERPTYFSFELIHNIPIFINYTGDQLKRLFFIIQISCAGFSLVICVIYFAKKCYIVEPNPESDFSPPYPIPSRRLVDIPPMVPSLPPTISTKPHRKIELTELKTRKQIPVWSTTNPTTFQSSHAPPF